MNSSEIEIEFVRSQKMYFSDSYKQFEQFGGPCVYFHNECLEAGSKGFLSQRHVEMLYATLTAWGLHRMGDLKITKTKLTQWDTFHDSLCDHANELRQFLGYKMIELTEEGYSESICQLRHCYDSLKLSEADSTVVVNSKALYHLFPNFIPPIDRQYTVRFFNQSSDKWRNSKKKFSTIPLPAGCDAQFKCFHDICMKIKKLADQIDPGLFKEQRSHGVTVPKAMDNAIVNFVRIHARKGKDTEGFSE